MAELDAKSIKTAYDWHLYYVFLDDTFVESANTIKHLKREELKVECVDIASTFCIKPADVYRYVVSGAGPALKVSSGQYSKGVISFEKDFNGLRLNLEPTIRYEEYIALWKKISKEQKEHFGLKSTKRKPPLYPRLIYAVFKNLSILKTNKYKEIFRMYQLGKLPYFEGGESVIFKSEYELKKYYLRYAPKKYRT